MALVGDDLCWRFVINNKSVAAAAAASRPQPFTSGRAVRVSPRFMAGPAGFWISNVLVCRSRLLQICRERFRGVYKLGVDTGRYDKLLVR